MAWSLLSAVLGAAATAVPAGDYVSWWKTVPVIILLLLWGRLVTWIDKDSQAVMLPRIPLNVANMLGAVLALFLFFILPGFIVGMLVLIVILGAEAGAYFTMRN